MKAGLQLVGMPMMNPAGEELGRVVDLLFDDDCRHVIGVTLARRRLRAREQFVAFDDLHTFADDAVIASPRRTPFGRSRRAPARNQAVQGKAVVSERGRYLGTVADVLFDERSGRIEAYAVASTRGERQVAVISADAVPVVSDVVLVTEHEPRVGADPLAH